MLEIGLLKRIYKSEMCQLIQISFTTSVHKPDKNARIFNYKSYTFAIIYVSFNDKSVYFSICIFAIRPYLFS